jgi:predicted Rossmann fold nucleotide-binding protein DprA/Smf involved in DNA uptake
VLEEYSYIYPHSLDLSGLQFKPSKFFGNIQEDQAYKNTEKKQNIIKINNEPAAKKEINGTVSKDALYVYDIFKKDALHINDIAQITGLSAGVILKAITELELLGYIRLHQGRKYILN